MTLAVEREVKFATVTLTFSVGRSKYSTFANWCEYAVFIYLGFYVAFNTVQVISQWVVGRAEETSSYIWPRCCTVNCRPTASNHQLSYLRQCRDPNPGLRGGRRGCYHSATVAPTIPIQRSLPQVQGKTVLFKVQV